MKKNPTKKDQFARLVTDRLLSLGEKQSILYDRREFRLMTDQQKLNLSTYYKQFIAASRVERNEIVQHMARMWFGGDELAPPEQFEEVRTRLLPRIKTRAAFELGRLEKPVDTEGSTLAYKQVGGHLGMGLVYPNDEAITWIAEDTIAAWGVSDAEVFEVAERNLRNLAAPKFVTMRDGLYISDVRDNYNATRMTIVDVIDQLKVRGKHVVMVPTSPALAVTGSEDAKGLAAMVEAVRNEMKGPRRICSLAFVLDGGSWHAWLPDPLHPQFNLLRRWQIDYLATAYGQQLRLLREGQSDGDDIYVSEYYRAESPDGRTMTNSFCPCCRTLLPKTDIVLFALPGKKAGDFLAVPWEGAVASLGPALEVTDLYPRRFRIAEKLSEQQFRELATWNVKPELGPECLPMVGIDD